MNYATERPNPRLLSGALLGTKPNPELDHRLETGKRNNHEPKGVPATSELGHSVQDKRTKQTGFVDCKP
jgi:hypothetical protein